MYLCLILLLFLIFFSAFWASVSAAPWLPTKNSDVRRMIALAEIKPNDLVYDLGCGDGRLVFAAVRAGGWAVGIELFFLLYLFAKLKSFFVPGSRIIWGNFFRHNLGAADVILIFLTPRGHKKIADKLKREMKTGARLVTICWPIEGWSSIKIDRPDNQLPLFLYKIKN